MIGKDYLFSDVGIDSVGFSAPRYYVDIEELAKKRDVDPAKYRKGLLLKEMRISDVDEDIISIGLKAGFNALERGQIDPQEIDAIFVGTETMTYAVKSVANIFAQLLDVSSSCLTQDVYNACAGGTLAVLNAIGLIERGVINKALVISADISSYPLKSPSEPTQGSGAVALVISKYPRVARFGKEFGKVSGNINDFWRAPGDKNAHVFGHYSLDSYLELQLQAYDNLIDNMGENFYADYYAFHAPFSKMPLKCIRNIIEKRWVYNMGDLLKLEEGTSLADKLFNTFDSFLQDISVLPEYIYLNLKERGLSSKKLEKLSNFVVSNVKHRVLPHLSVPMHFGNMYNAALWSQIEYILENSVKENDTIYFGSYGSGATAIAGLLKVNKGFEKIIERSPTIKEFISYKQKKSIEEYERIKKGKVKPKRYIARVAEIEDLNEERGFTLHFCDEGCIIPNIDTLNHCPQGHSGFHERRFPLYAKLVSEPQPINSKDYSYLKDGLVRVEKGVSEEDILEYDVRRVELSNNDLVEKGLLNWSPYYQRCLKYS